MTENLEKYMHRCFDLAVLGAGKVSPNPMVGAVLVYNERIIGEGWHREYGQAHAEVNAVKSVKPVDRHLIKDSTLFVSLEPCCIHGKTPPCTDLILKNKIPRVVVSVTDQTPEVKGRGLSVLRNAGVEVITDVLPEKGAAISAFRNTWALRKRPYIILKFARSKDGFMGMPGQQVWISNELSKRWVHKLRSSCDAILVGTRTAITDNPQLTNRLWSGTSPLRIILDRKRVIPDYSALLTDEVPTWIVTEKALPLREQGKHTVFHRIPFGTGLLPALMNLLYENRITSLLVEGGAFTLQRFVEAGLWDEAWVFTGNETLGKGIPAPWIPGKIRYEIPVTNNVLTIYGPDSG